MTHYCSEAMDLIKDVSDKPHYVQCGKVATHCVPDSIYEEGYYLCPVHAEIGTKKKWTVEKL